VRAGGFDEEYRVPGRSIGPQGALSEQDDNQEVRAAYADDNLKANEVSLPEGRDRRRCERTPAGVTACACDRVSQYIVSATTPFLPADFSALRLDVPRVVRQRVPGYEGE
jgi:UDP-glucose 4-epimerase